MSQLTVAERVAAGAAALDEAVPGWWHDINLNTLDIESACNCILGQTFGNFCDDRADWLRYADGRPIEVERGFVSESWPEDLELEDEWRRLIEARRAAS